MKAAMNHHVDQERHVMFRDSAMETMERLKMMIQNQERIMSDRADEVFVLMRRDYRSVLGGGDTHGELPPKSQRMMRNEVNSILEGVENMFREVIGEESDGNRDDTFGQETGPNENLKNEETEGVTDRTEASNDGKLKSNHNRVRCGAG